MRCDGTARSGGTQGTEPAWWHEATRKTTYGGLMSEKLFSRHYDVGSEMLLDFLQQAMAGLPTVTSYQLDDSGDRITFTTSLTLTSWGENMVAAVESDGRDGSVLNVSGEPRVGALSTPWGEEIHAA